MVSSLLPLLLAASGDTAMVTARFSSHNHCGVALQRAMSHVEWIGHTERDSSAQGGLSTVRLRCADPASPNVFTLALIRSGAEAEAPVYLVRAVGAAPRAEVTVSMDGATHTVARGRAMRTVGAGGELVQVAGLVPFDKP